MRTRKLSCLQRLLLWCLLWLCNSLLLILSYTLLWLLWLLLSLLLLCLACEVLLSKHCARDGLPFDPFIAHASFYEPIHHLQCCLELFHTHPAALHVCEPAVSQLPQGLHMVSLLFSPCEELMGGAEECEAEQCEVETLTIAT